MSSIINQLKLTTKDIYTCIISTLFLFIIFFPIISNFIWGNHDWTPINTTNQLHFGLIEGRFSQYFFLNLFFDGKILPILNNILGFFIYSYAIILLITKFFEYKIKDIIDILFIITSTTLPYINEILYFQFIAFTQLCWPFVITLSLLFAKQSYFSNSITNTTLSTFCLLIAIGGYPATANLFVTATILFFIKESLKKPNLKTLITKSLPFAISLIIAFIILKIIHTILQNNNQMISLYNNSAISLNELITHFPITFITSIKSLLQPQPFFSLIFKLTTTLIILIFATNYITQKQKFSNKLINILLILVLFIGIKFSALLTKETTGNYFSQYDPIGFMIRTDFYSKPILILFCLFYLKQKKSLLLKNLIFSLSIITLILNIHTNLHFSKIQYLGFKAENLFLDRAINRIKNSTNYNSNNIYDIIQTGEISLRNKYYKPFNNEKYGYYTLQTPYTRYWIPSEYYNFYTSKPFVKEGNSISSKDISQTMSDFITNKITPWPSPNSIYIDNNYIIISLTKDGQDLFKRQFFSLERQL